FAFSTSMRSSSCLLIGTRYSAEPSGKSLGSSITKRPLTALAFTASIPWLCSSRGCSSFSRRMSARRGAMFECYWCFVLPFFSRSPVQLWELLSPGATLHAMDDETLKTRSNSSRVWLLNHLGEYERAQAESRARHRHG